MYISRIQNQPNFGINYVNKASWNKDFLRAFEKSNLVKDIDKKYPAAYARYTKFMEEDMANAEPNYHVSFILNLAQNKIWTCNLDSHSSEGADRALRSVLAHTPLSEIEKQAKNTVDKIKTTIEIKPVKRNPVKDFFKNLFLY